MQTGFVQGADFKFLAANVVRKDNAKTLFRPYSIRRFQGKKIGFIGMTLEGTPSIVSPSGIANLNFLDEAATANRYAKELKRRHGVKAIVVLLHEGGFQSIPFNTNPASYTGCTGLSGPVLDIVNNTTDDVDMFITGHTHQPYNCVVDGRPVTSASSAGRLISDIDLTIGRNGDVKNVKADEPPDVRGGPHAAEERRRPREVLRGAVAAAAGDHGRADRGGHHARSRPGRLARERARQPDRRRAARRHGELPTAAAPTLALMNPGGVRADLTYARSGSETEDGIVTYEEAFTVQPFNNLVDHPDVHGRAAARRAQGPVVRDELGADGAAAVEHPPLHVRSVDRRGDPRPSRARGRRTRSPV